MKLNFRNILGGMSMEFRNLQSFPFPLQRSKEKTQYDLIHCKLR